MIFVSRKHQNKSFCDYKTPANKCVHYHKYVYWLPSPVTTINHGAKLPSTKVSCWHVPVHHLVHRLPLSQRPVHLCHFIRPLCINSTLQRNTPQLSFGFKTIHFWEGIYGIHWLLYKSLFNKAALLSWQWHLDISQHASRDGVNT